jgi:2-amino-4-hydroxy-6-hydroxymethyldihydropteridine diphosphokinase
LCWPAVTSHLPIRVAIALGSNLGNRERNLARAVEALRSTLTDVQVSSFIETAPVGVTNQPLFLNGALVATTSLAARPVLELLLDLELQLGRVRPYAQAPRTIDLDLILFGDQQIDEPGLSVPHPRFRERRFVLEPLVEIASDLRDPVTGCTVAELLLDLIARGQVS